MDAKGSLDRAITIHEAKTHLSRLISRVEGGEEIVLARGSKPVAKIVPLSPPPLERRVPGRFAHLLPPGKDPLSDGFWDPLPPEHLGMGDDQEAQQ
jgi:prevent-host-death family protein